MTSPSTSEVDEIDGFVLMNSTPTELSTPQSSLHRIVGATVTITGAVVGVSLVATGAGLNLISYTCSAIASVTGAIGPLCISAGQKTMSLTTTNDR
jgi:hypothetical protein